MGLGRERGVGVFIHQAFQGRQGLLHLAGILIGPRQLVHHLVIARLVGVSGKEVEIEADGGLGVHGFLIFVGHCFTAPVTEFQLQVCQAPLGLDFQGGAGTGGEEFAVALQGLQAAAFQGLVGLDHDIAVLQVLEGAMLLALHGQAGAEQGEDRDRQTQAGHHGWCSLSAARS